MADWPLLGELKQVLDVTSDDWDGDADDTRLTRLLGAAIEQTKHDIGAWDEEVDLPTSSQAQAALRMAELLASKVDAGEFASVRLLATDPLYRRLLKGSRRYFGVA